MVPGDQLKMAALKAFCREARDDETIEPIDKLGAL